MGVWGGEEGAGDCYAFGVVGGWVVGFFHGSEEGFGVGAGEVSEGVGEVGEVAVVFLFVEEVLGAPCAGGEDDVVGCVGVGGWFDAGHEGGEAIEDGVGAFGVDVPGSVVLGECGYGGEIVDGGASLFCEVEVVF